ncbi:hypothetical protein LRD18_10510 [Halorhodospira halochloris]|uniref:hypothetical protein n=1 Tax=Halorhodospira halochloris TaxID=1052 RepID=UPI001EE8CE13|nr:hypothetical protein [Halorhodospira halochloris]MCG5531287.1 hypothetical protein [Halorhodospira halochloris]
MSTFAIETDAGLIPSERITRVIQPKGNNLITKIEYLAEKGGREIAQTQVPVDNADFLPVIPATPGYELLELFPDPDVSDGIAVDRTPIIAWRIEGQAALPVTALDPPSEKPVILTPSGAVITNDTWYQSLDVYKSFYKPG